MKNNNTNVRMNLDMCKFWQSLTKNICIQDESNFNLRYNFKMFSKRIFNNKNVINIQSKPENYIKKINHAQRIFANEKKFMKYFKNKKFNNSSRKVKNTKTIIPTRIKYTKYKHIFDNRKKLNKSIDFIIDLEKNDKLNKNNSEIDISPFYKTKFYKIIFSYIKNYNSDDDMLVFLFNKLKDFYINFIKEKKFIKYIKSRSIDNNFRNKKIKIYYISFDDYVKILINNYNITNKNNKFRGIYINSPNISNGILYKMNSLENNHIDKLQQNNSKIYFYIKKISKILNFDLENIKPQTINSYVNFYNKKMKSIFKNKSLKKFEIIKKMEISAEKLKKKSKINKLKIIYNATRKFNSFKKLNLEQINKYSFKTMRRIKPNQKNIIDKVKIKFKKSIISKTNKNINSIRSINKDIDIAEYKTNKNDKLRKFREENIFKSGGFNNGIKKEYFKLKTKIK